MVGDDDSVPAPENLAGKLGSATGSGNRQSTLYGWPTVVIKGRDHTFKVAPLFVVQIEPKQDPASLWQLHATGEPEFNLAITASRLFDRSIVEDIDEALGDALPFGDAEAFANLAEKIAGRLGLDILSPLDPGGLDPDVGRKQGVYNAAISVLAEKSDYNSGLLEELRLLQTRNDWKTTAAAYLVAGESAPNPGGKTSTGPLAAPLPCNRSQEETLQHLRRKPLTVVTGPPGTGKTQLVVNAVTNAWLDGDKVLVTSTNNAAVDVAVGRATKDICDGLLIRTGNRSEREQVSTRITAALDQAKNHKGSQAKVNAGLKQAATRRMSLMENLTRLDELDDRLLSVAKELETTRSDLAASARKLWHGINPPGHLPDSDKIEQRARRLLRTRFFPRFRARRVRQQLGCAETTSLEQIATWARLDRHQAALNRKLEAGRNEYRQIEEDLGDPAISIPEEDRKWTEASLQAIRADTAAHIRVASGRLDVFGGAPSGRAFQNFVGNALHDLRGWACTALSANRNFPLDAGLFDLVIIDEASQCALATVLPLAYRAKRLAVVGDPCQLQPIIPLGDRLMHGISDEAGLDDGDLRRRGIHHKSGSAYLAYEFAARPNPPILLNEHYRCHPRIARWFNRTFYGDELAVLTSVEEKDRAILWRDVEGTAARPQSRTSWHNRAEAEQTVAQLGILLDSGLSIGVVTPFAAQAQLIDSLAERRFGRPVLDEADFVCGTAHRLQGDERDAILISTVLSPQMSESGVRWMEKERNLLNVAISRARRALIVLGHPYVGALGSPTLASLRTYLREEVDRDKGNDEMPHANYHLASESERRLLDAMQLDGLEPYAKLNVQGYELDFALMGRGIKLNIEVDGDQHLDVRGRQRRQDLTRDRVLADLGWTVLRIPAWRCHEEDVGPIVTEIKETRDRLLAGPCQPLPA